MTADKTHSYRQRWRDIERKQRDLDFTRSQWARDLRSEFGPGADGDNAFAKWCAQEIGLGLAGARELLNRAEAVELVPEESAWTEYGGFREIRRVLPLTKYNRTRVLNAARTNDRPVRTIRAMVRGLSPAPKTVTAKDDATRLAAYLVAKRVALTPSIQEVVYRYVAKEKLLRAA